jgi:2-polyprenyl-3-methyl-5-hydroxy-6-metoxy-1,4-benzoquinol methylase
MTSFDSLPTERIEQCILCPESRNVSDPNFAYLLGLKEPFDVRICDACGLRWLSPRPTRAGYEEVYSYENYFDGPESVEQFADLAQERQPYFRKRLQHIESLLGDNQMLKILDIGAATGEFVYEALQRGHETKGLEFSQGARNEALRKYGIPLLGDSLEDLENTERFDVVHLNHVFEHLPDPTGTLKIVSKLIADGGLLVIEVPQQLYNDLDRVRRLLRLANKPALTPYSLHHTYFFSPKTLQQLLENFGFSIEALKTANWNRTPLLPFSIRNALLGSFLALADRMHSGGNIIEVYARR